MCEKCKANQTFEDFKKSKNKNFTMNYEEITKKAIEKLDDQWQQFFADTWDLFRKKPAAINHHHNFEGGLVRHVAEMLHFGSPLTKISNIEEESFIKVVLLHDYAKLQNYEIIAPGNIKYINVPYPVEFWTMNELARFGIALTDDEINALVMAEGGWSEYEKIQSSRLASLLHICDMWSAKVISPKITVSCPVCEGDMALREGPRGQFYGCMAFPNCKGTLDINNVELKPIENMDKHWDIFTNKTYNVGVDMAKPGSDKTVDVKHNV